MAERRIDRIEVEIDGTRVQLADWKETKDLDVKAQARGIAPNFVHSMDASAMTTTMNYAKLEGLNSLTVIHDSYGAPAADMHHLARLIRKAFVWTYDKEVLGDFLKACKDVSRDKDAKWPEKLPMGNLDLQDVLEADYFFA